MKKTALFLFAFFIFCFANANPSLARDPSTITDWYIYSFDVSMQANADSSLLITEKIVADAGNLPDKHGIFRVLSTQPKIELISITDFDGKPYEYETIKDYFKKTITWKIGDPDITVNGKNNYQIVYKVKNAIRSENQNFDEFYWNLLGAFWEIPTDKFSAKIIFPESVNEKDSKVEYYAGYFGENQKNLAYYAWENPHTLIVNSTSTLEPSQAITISVTFPKGIFTPYQMSFFEKYGDWLWYLSFLLPLAIFAYAFKKWQKYGKDPKMKKPIPPEFGIPDDITPIQMGMVVSHGAWRDKFITASVVDLAVKGFMTIEETEKKSFIFKNREIKLVKNPATDKAGLAETERKLFDAIFEGKEEISLSKLKKDFYKKVDGIKKSAQKDSIRNGWIGEKSMAYSIGFFVTGAFLAWSCIWAAFFSPVLSFGIFLSGVILIIFGIFMPKRTKKGVDLLFKIKGFERYMRQAEDYRQQFYEKENIFDKFLPYAIVFGIAGLWAKKMQKIYGDDFYKNYHSAWYHGVSGDAFNESAFTSRLNSITSSISQSMSSSSGASGSGGAGGGGGGGGGGGW